MWLEKYRPKTLNQFYGNKSIIKSFKTCLQNNKIPNMIVAGPPGVGKTSLITCLARLFLKQKFKIACKQLNASDQRGIDVVRNQIKQFANKEVRLQKTLQKIMILDEADSMTEGAQQALRMIISDHIETTRFFLSCNESSKLIDPIQSRCIILRFPRLSDQDIQQCLNHIIKMQNVKIDESGIKALLFTADGDMRQAINNLQASHFCLQQGKVIDQDHVFKVSDLPPFQILKSIVFEISKKNFSNASEKLNILFKKGYSAYDIVNSIYKTMLSLQDRLNKQRLFEMIRSIGEYKRRILQGLGTQIQLNGWLADCVLQRN